VSAEFPKKVTTNPFKGKMAVLIIFFLRHGSQSLGVSKLVPVVAKLLSDPVSSVRDSAFNTLVEIYRFVGERLRHDLIKKQLIPATK
jgi:HEAT repeat